MPTFAVLAALLGAFQADDPRQALADRIDAALVQEWKQQGLAPAPAADDATWLRRLSLDLCGAIPRPGETERFLADPRPDKRERKIDEFLADRRFAENQAQIWSDLLLSASGKDALRTEPWILAFLEEEFAKGTSFAAITELLIRDSGTREDPGSLGYILSYREAIETLSGVTARAFLGLQIQCAQCHDHPYDTWKQDDFNRFTGFFYDMRADHVPGGKSKDGLFRVDDSSPERNLELRVRRMLSGRRDNADPSMEPPPTGDDETDEARRRRRARRTKASKTLEPEPSMEGTPEESTDMSSMSESDDGSPIESNEDRAAILELLKLCQRARPGESPFAALESDPAKLDEFLRRLPPSLRDSVEKYRERKASFGTAGFLDGAPLQPGKAASRRSALARWMTAAENPWYGRAIANRTWGHLFGKGLIEPVDDLTGSTDRVLPELLDAVGAEFQAHGADLRFLIGALARTRAYALDNVTAETAADPEARARAERWFAAHPMRRFSAGQMARSLRPLTGREADLELVPQGYGRDDLDEEGERHEALMTELAPCFADEIGGGAGATSASIPQALFLMNGGYADDAALPEEPELRLAFDDASLGAVERLRRLFYAALSRAPTAAEAERLLDRPHAFDDVFWALLNSTEFHTNR